ncbi:membrane dipeptidase [Prevotella sp. E2-28]|uniref:membrane dipeptidase n=1 Tax=Prevotella sp. E2-28 TaxID=2913620 RepID=UPI001EDBFEA6|nr:membrane dipeptidase [Prevotella sp. E2-28]UKK53526.1 membrane dipeptidase [Prevotella sp. E2-28]
MRQYDLNAILADVHQNFPVAQRRPVIGITGNYNELTCKLGEGYYKQVVAAGGVPMIIPPVSDKTVLADTLDRIDALLLSGGADINPLYCGEEPVPGLGGINCERDLPELLITRMAYNRQLPILGICRGIQTLAVALDGKVDQDIKLTNVKHSQDADRSEPTHSVSIEKNSTLYNIYSGSQTSTLYVNSFHHQAVSDAGPRFRVVARAADNVIEAIESSEFKSILGVQWHPECLGEDGLPLFQWLVNEAKKFKDVKCLHHHILTLDTHCDTPMFFPQNVNFSARDPRILVDLHKMTEGRQDATIMVAYLPQNSEQWKGVKGEKRAFADDIFDKIEQIVDANANYLALARTPQQLWDNKRAGKKSIMMGIENGLALDGDISNIKHFKDRGIVYVTLCHNGDNDICDSARGNETFGGVSAFGRQVIEEMNRLGVMVDLSHAHERSFYDALELSKTPIVCSHSSARALCDHPRNLTDDQMRALAAKGGVCQITLYNGFLKKDGEATILDAMQHLDHAIQVMGIDHVGLGTDFDGDGGIRGLANSSELTNFTRQLLARRYSDADIQKIWGGNFLRVMQQVQDYKL